MTTTPTCRTARLALLAGHEEPDADALRTHLDGCPACQAFVTRDRALLTRLRGVHPPLAPVDLRTAVQMEAAMLARARRFRRRAFQGALPLAAALLLTLPFLRPTPTLSDVVALATTQAPVRAHFTADSPEAVSAWLRRESAMDVEVPGIGGATVLAARALTVQGAPAVLVFYRMGSDTLTYLSLVAWGGRTPRLADTLHLVAAGRYRVVLWEEPGGLRAVAAVMPERAVLAVAAECRAKALMRGS